MEIQIELEQQHFFLAAETFAKVLLRFASASLDTADHWNPHHSSLTYGCS